jgi:hypothetical protein
LNTKFCGLRKLKAVLQTHPNQFWDKTCDFHRQDHMWLPLEKQPWKSSQATFLMDCRIKAGVLSLAS